MILDPLLSDVIGRCTEHRLLEALRTLYPDNDWPATQICPQLTKWLRNAQRQPGLSLSTGRTNSFKGMATCALLQVLEVPSPKGPRNRMMLAWAILESSEAKRVLGPNEELDAARARWLEHVGAKRS